MDKNQIILNSKLDCYKQTFKTDVLPDDFDEKDRFKISRNINHYYLQFNFDDTQKLPHQGFKIHISTTWSNYKNILNLVYLFCKRKKVSFKYISNEEAILKNLSGSCSLWEAGKFITIYPSTFFNFKNILSKLHKLLDPKNEEGIDVLTDRRYKDSNNIFYRYGVIVGPDKNIYDPNGKILYQDYKKIGYYLPSFVSEPFPFNVDDVKKEKYIFTKYKPIMALNSKASGSTFKVTINNKNTLAILKNAKSGYQDFENTEIQKLKNEEKILKEYSTLGLFPKYIDSFYEDKDYFLVESLIDGVSVDTFRAMPEHRFNESNYKNIYLIFAKVIKNLLCGMKRIHENNLFLGDISANNILINLKSKKIYFIDLGQTSNLDFPIDQKKIFYRTSTFFDEQTKYLSLEAQDNKQMGYLIMSLFSRANMFLKMDFTGKTSIKFFKQYAKLYNIPSNFVDIIVTLITNSDISLNELIQKLEWKNVSTYSKHEITVSYPTKLFMQLKKTSIATKIDGLNFDDGLRTRNEFYIAEMNFLKDSEQYSKIFTDEFAKKVMDKSDEIIRNFKDISNSKLSLDKILALTFCACYSVNKDNKNKLLSNIAVLLDYLNRYYKVEKNNKIYYRIMPSSKFLSPYLYDGMAGVLNVLLILKERYHITTYDKLIFVLAKELSTELMPKCASFKRGLSGIIYVLLKYREIYNNDSYDLSIKEMINCLEFYTYNFENSRYVIDTTFSKATVNFIDGNEGVLKVLKMAQILY